LSAMGITLNQVAEGGPMSAELAAGLRCSGLKTGSEPTVSPTAWKMDEAEHAQLAAAVAEAAVRVVRDPAALLPAASGTRAGVLIPRLGDVAHRVPIEDNLRATAALLRPQVGASVAVLRVAVHPDEA